MSGYIGDCIKFYDDTETRLYTQGRHIKIVDDSGCWSYVGSVFEGEQLLSLKQPGCVWKKTVQHELTHALGFLHEQSRPDRDLYIEVHEDRIKTDMAHNYDKMPTTNWNDLGGIYDWKSNMHYEYWYFWTDAAAAQNLPTMTVRANGQPVYINSQRNSSIDMMQIAQRYSEFCPAQPTFSCTNKDAAGNDRYALQTHVCDGIHDCPDGSDETDAACATTGTSTTTTTTSTTKTTRSTTAQTTTKTTPTTTTVTHFTTTTPTTTIQPRE